MTHPTAKFFDELGRRGHEPLLARIEGTMRFDLEHDQQTDHWLVTITRGDVTVSREERAADLVVHADRTFFDRIASGEIRPLVAWLQNGVLIQGRSQLFILLERLIPPRPQGRHPVAAGEEARPR